MAKINLLDSSIYNLLSAGEVVENPASIVKELVENSIDAGATQITVGITGGGIKSIVVVDNGVGIEPTDIEKAVLPHATSKIKDAKELQTISSLGFRGEALPSIAAVSELEIKSKYIDSPYASMLSVRGGTVGQTQTIPFSKGTSVKVSNLFYNTPARLKFLKSAGAEQAAVTHTLRNLALANPLIVFRYTQDDKEIFSTSGGGLEDAIFTLYGKQVTDNLIQVSATSGDIKINGYISTPKLTKNNRRFQTLIINSRLLSSTEIQASIHNAYAHRLMTRCYPLYVLDIIMPFDSVDVNVHPQKATVRFADARAICSASYYAVKNALEKYEQEQLLSVTGLPAAMLEDSNANKDIQVQEATSNSKQSVKEIKEGKGLLEAYNYKPARQDFGYINTVKPSIDRVASKSSDPTIVPKLMAAAASKPTQNEFLAKKAAADINYKVIGQVFETYILVEIGSEIIFIDQHAAHERILFDKMLADYGNKSATQPLLMPIIYECAYDDVTYLQQMMPTLTNAGFEIEGFGENHFKVNATPLALGNIDINAFLNAVIKDKYSKKNDILEEYIAKKACIAAIKAGEGIDNNIIDYVLDYFIANSLPLHCPHGRPTLIKFTRKELDTLFGRIV